MNIDWRKEKIGISKKELEYLSRMIYNSYKYRKPKFSNFQIDILISWSRTINEMDRNYFTNIGFLISNYNLNFSPIKHFTEDMHKVKKRG